MLEVIKELLLVTLELALSANELKNLRGLGTLLLDGRKTTGKDCLSDQGNWHAEIKSVDGGPLSGTLLSSRIHNFLEERSSVIVVEVHDIAGNFDQERVENTLVPSRENIANLLVWHSESTLHDIVGLGMLVKPSESSWNTYFANQLHVTVFNTVVYHLDVVTSTFITNPLTAWVTVITITLGSDALENILNVWPSLLVSTGHQRGTVSGTLLTTGDTGTDKSDTLGSQVFCAAVGIGEMGVTAIDDDIALLAVWKEGLDEVVDWLSGHNQKHHTAGFLELANEIFDRVCTLDRLAWNLIVSVDGYWKESQETNPWPRWQGKHQPWRRYG